MQTSYGSRSNAYAGGIVYGSRRGVFQSRKCETAAGIDFGTVVSQGTADTGCVVGGTTPIGVAIRDQGQGMDEDNAGKYEQYSMVSVLDKDFIWMETESASGAYRDPVYYDTTTGLAVVTASPAEDEVPIGYLAQTLSAAGLIKVWVDSDLYYRSVSDAAILVDAAEAAATADEDVLEDAAEAAALLYAADPVTTLALTPGATQIAATWVDAADTDHVEVQAYVTSTGVVAATMIVAAAAEAATITGLSNDTEYTVTVKSVDAEGNISAGVSDTATPTAG